MVQKERERAEEKREGRGGRKGRGKERGHKERERAVGEMHASCAWTQYLPKDQNYVEMALREMRSRTQVEVSPGQQGCHRRDVDCYGLA